MTYALFPDPLLACALCSESTLPLVTSSFCPRLTALPFRVSFAFRAARASGLYSRDDPIVGLEAAQGFRNSELLPGPEHGGQQVGLLVLENVDDHDDDEQDEQGPAESQQYLEIAEQQSMRPPWTFVKNVLDGCHVGSHNR